MNETELAEDHWVLAHEANIKGWLPNVDTKDFVAAHKEFGTMKTTRVSFYDVTASFDIDVKSADAEYGKRYLIQPSAGSGKSNTLS